MSMGAKQEGILLGELKEFKANAMDEFEAIRADMRSLKTNIEELSRWKWKMSGAIIAVAVIFEASVAILRLLKN